MPATTDDFDCESALEACARGERLALRALYERDARWLLGVALRIVRNRDTAHEVLQEAFLQVWQRASTYQRALGSGRGWVYTVVRHRALDEARRTRRDVLQGADELEEAAAQAPADNALQPHFGDLHALNRCLDSLDERKRDCIVSAFVEGYTHDQIATDDSGDRTALAGEYVLGLLGLVPAGNAFVLPAARSPAIGEQQLFELTLEADTGSATKKPTGPILYVGRSVRL